MRKILITLAAVASLIAAVDARAQETLDSPMTKAMMDVYDAEIAANPAAYDIYFRRANEYYKFNQYLRALSDIDQAIKYTPAADTDMLLQCWFLKGEIYQMLNKQEEALEAFTKALELDPTSFMALYQKANCEFALGQYSNARVDYLRMRSQNPRSVEALTGLARVALKEQNLGMASQYMDDAVAMMPTDSDIYVRRASIRRQLNNNTGAVQDLLMAISIDSNGKAFQQLIDISNDDYPAVYTALSDAINQAPDQGMFYYIRAVIAQAHDRFPAAIEDYIKIIDNNFYNYAGIYASLAECYYALCEFPLALENINQAIGMTADNAPYYIILSKIHLAQDHPAEAKRAIDNAIQVLPADNDALIQKGITLFALKRYDEASTLFGTMIMDNPLEPMPYLLQGWTIAEGTDAPAKALPIYRRMAQIDTNHSTLRSYHGFALLFGGKQEEAIKWMEDILGSTTDTDGSAHYTAACLYAQAGLTEEAFNALERALALGYANLYNIRMNDVARVNIEPLRKGADNSARLSALLKSYAYLFR